MIRPREGDFKHNVKEIGAMVDQIHQFKQMHQDWLSNNIKNATGKLSGFVFGVLNEGDGFTINADATKRLVEASRPYSVTFHRAFDVIEDKREGLKLLQSLGVDRVLTSGCRTNAIDGMEELQKLVELSEHMSPRGPIIIAGGGVRDHNVVDLVKHTGVREVHASVMLKAALSIR
jgi:copper homeostasis protein